MHKAIFNRAVILSLMFASLIAVHAAERKPSGWKALFDGKSTVGWRAYGKADFPTQGWVVQDGCLHLEPKGKGGDIITTAEFDNFDLQWDWRIAPKANNGIKYLVTEKRPDAPGHEYQMIDDATVTDAKHQTASFYDVLPPQKKPAVKPPGQWNHSRLLIQGNHVEHWLNDAKVLAYELGSDEVKAAVAKSKFNTAAGFGEKIKGHILLTDHGGETWYRNIKILELREK